MNNIPRYLVGQGYISVNNFEEELSLIKKQNLLLWIDVFTKLKKNLLVDISGIIKLKKFTEPRCVGLLILIGIYRDIYRENPQVVFPEELEEYIPVIKYGYNLINYGGLPEIPSLVSDPKEFAYNISEYIQGLQNNSVLREKFSQRLDSTNLEFYCDILIHNDNDVLLDEEKYLFDSELFHRLLTLIQVNHFQVSISLDDIFLAVSKNSCLMFPVSFGEFFLCFLGTFLTRDLVCFVANEFFFNCRFCT